jgi:diguanylate cyclase (GGDEF)-like protein
LIEKPKKQLFKTQVFLLAILGVPLVAFFVFAASFQNSVFVILALGLFISILYLIPLQHRISIKLATYELQMEDLRERSNLVEAEIHREETAINAYQGKIVNFSQLKRLTERLSMCLTLEDTTRALTRETHTFFSQKDSTIILYLFQSQTGELGISISQKGDERVNLKAKKGDFFDQWVVRSTQPLLIEDSHSDYRFDGDKVEKEDVRIIRSLISVPLLVHNKAVGILRVDSPLEKKFDMEDLRLLTTIADMGAVAIENAQLFDRLEQMAIQDGLTGLYLRRYLMVRLEEEINRQVRRKNQLSFMMVDLDHFKQYNDRFGHTAGDIVLKILGRMLMEFFKEPGTLICRYGGEEFAVLLVDCSKEKAFQLAEEFRRAMAEEIIVLRREKTHVTVSIGIASYPEDAHNKEELIHKADLAMYKAKEAGRNKVVSL